MTKKKQTSKRVPNPFPNGWISVEQRLRFYGVRGCALGVAYQEAPGGYQAFAIETDGDDVEAVLASHGHKLLGTYKEASRAREACENFAHLWLLKPSVARKIERCRCAEMES